VSIVLVGGMARMEQHYRGEAEKFGVTLTVFNEDKAGLEASIRNKDAVVVFTNKVSHRGKQKAMDTARKNNIPVFMFHSCGLCTLRECFHCLRNATKERGGPYR